MSHFGLRLRRMIRRQPWFPALAALMLVLAAFGDFPWAFAAFGVVMLLVLLSRPGHVGTDSNGDQVWVADGDSNSDSGGSSDSGGGDGGGGGK